MTSNEVAQRDDTAGELALAEPGGLVAWAHRARQAHQIAISLAKTSFVPKAMQGRPDEITGAILAGDELGLPPMASLKAIHIIAGTPALSANAMRGLVLARGHQIEVVESTDTVCRVRGRRAGTDSWQEVLWTIERAQKMGLVARNDEYKKQPKTMLVARATAEICRLIAADVLYAVPYAVEELEPVQQRPAVEPDRPVTREEIMGAAEPEREQDWPDVAEPGSGQVPEGGGQ